MPEGPRILIQLMPDGSVNVTGPLSNKVLCYGLIESAKEVIAKLADNHVTAAPVGLLDPLGSDASKEPFQFRNGR